MLVPTGLQVVASKHPPCYGNSAICSQSIPDSGDAAFKVCCSCLVESPQLADPLSCLANKAAQRVGQLGRFHKTAAAHLKSRIATVRDTLTADSRVAITGGMLARHDLKASRDKHDVFAASRPMIATKLIVNHSPSLGAKKRSQVRAQVLQLEMAAASVVDADQIRGLANKAAQRVGQLGRFHKTAAAHLKSRIATVRDTLTADSRVAITGERAAHWEHLEGENPWSY